MAFNASGFINLAAKGHLILLEALTKLDYARCSYGIPGFKDVGCVAEATAPYRPKVLAGNIHHVEDKHEGDAVHTQRPVLRNSLYPLTSILCRLSSTTSLSLWA